MMPFRFPAGDAFAMRRTFAWHASIRHAGDPRARVRRHERTCDAGFEGIQEEIEHPAKPGRALP